MLFSFFLRLCYRFSGFWLLAAPQDDFLQTKECALAHSCACDGRLRHPPYTSQCASSRSVFDLQESNFLEIKKGDLIQSSPPDKTPLPFMFRIIAIGLSLVNTSVEILSVYAYGLLRSKLLRGLYNPSKTYPLLLLPLFLPGLPRLPGTDRGACRRR